MQQRRTLWFTHASSLKKNRSINVPWRGSAWAWVIFRQFGKGSHRILILLKLTITGCCLIISFHQQNGKRRCLMTSYAGSQRTNEWATLWRSESEWKEKIFSFIVKTLRIPMSKFVICLGHLFVIFLFLLVLTSQVKLFITLMVTAVLEVSSISLKN